MVAARHALVRRRVASLAAAYACFARTVEKNAAAAFRLVNGKSAAVFPRKTV